MVHGYHNLQQWNQWLSQSFLGKNLLLAEQNLLSTLLKSHFGKHALLIGVPQQYELLTSTPIHKHSIVSPLIYIKKNMNDIEGDFSELPILTSSIDLVILPHTLDFVHNSRQVLAEACRITKPEGLIVILGFNPNSIWGIKKIFHKKHKIGPWSGHFSHPNKLKKWLRLADFELKGEKSILFRPPLNNQKYFERMHFLERLGGWCFPWWGGVYALVAKAKVYPLTPIRMKWKQQLTGIRVMPSMWGHIARAKSNHYQDPGTQ